MAGRQIDYIALAELERLREFEVVAITDMRINENGEREFFVTFATTSYLEGLWTVIQRLYGWQAQNVRNYMGYVTLNGRRRERAAKVLITWEPDWLSEDQLQGSQRLVNEFLARRRAALELVEIAAQALLALGGQ